MSVFAYPATRDEKRFPNRREDIQSSPLVLLGVNDEYRNGLETLQNAPGYRTSILPWPFTVCLLFNEVAERLPLKFFFGDGTAQGYRVI